jgi:hypothetical protein
MTHPGSTCYEIMDVYVIWPAVEGRGRDPPSVRNTTLIPHTLTAITTATLFPFQIAILEASMSTDLRR